MERQALDLVGVYARQAMRTSSNEPLKYGSEKRDLPSQLWFVAPSVAGVTGLAWLATALPSMNSVATVGEMTAATWCQVESAGIVVGEITIVSVAVVWIESRIVPVSLSGVRNMKLSLSPPKSKMRAHIEAETILDPQRNRE